MGFSGIEWDGRQTVAGYGDSEIVCSGGRPLERIVVVVAMLPIFALSAQELVQPNLDGLKYSALAKSASIQGIVQFVVKSDGIQLVSGHSMLVEAAKSNLEKWAQAHVSDIPLSVIYSFRLAEPKFIEVDEPIWDKFNRFFLRLFHLHVTEELRNIAAFIPKTTRRFLRVK
jgi:hypothetical protein